MGLVGMDSFYVVKSKTSSLEIKISAAVEAQIAPKLATYQ